MSSLIPALTAIASGNRWLKFDYLEMKKKI